jgi:hypothetical protein
MTKRPEELDDTDRHESSALNYTGYSDANSVTFRSAGGDWGTLRCAVIYDARPRTWRERLFSWPWRPWQRYRPPIAYCDLTA